MEEKKQNGHFKKVIGLFGGISLVAGMTIGSGVYYLGSYVLERTDFSFGLALLCWIIGIFMGNNSVDLSLSMEGTSAEGHGITGAISMIGFATFASLWAYEGWTNLNTVGEEMKNPKRDLPLAIIISLGFITLIYTLFQFAIYRVLPSDQIISMIQSGDIYLGNAVAKQLMGNFGHILILAGMTIGILGTINGDVLVFPRTYYAMAKEGFFPKKFAEIDEKSGVPVTASLASSGVAVILVVFNSLQSLTDLLITLSALLNVMCIGAVIIYRIKFPNLERPYKVWGGIPTVVITIILFGVLLVNNFIEDPKAAIVGLVIPLIGLVFYAYFKKKNGGQDYKGEGIE